MNKIKLILFFYFLSIKCERWFDEVNRADPDDPINGFAGDNAYIITDLYLCSDRNYRVHYHEGKYWSGEFSACQCVGYCNDSIDAIAISGGKEYACGTTRWFEEVSGYDINNYTNGFVGNLNDRIRKYYVHGGENYRSAFAYDSLCSSENTITKKIINDLFDKSFTDLNNKEIIIDYKNEINMTVQILNSTELNYKGNITIQIDGHSITDEDYGGIASNSLKRLLNDSVPINFDYIKFYFENRTCEYINNGIVSINFKWSDKKIEIDIAFKIKPEHYSFRGGSRIYLYLENAKNKLLPKIRDILRVFFKFSGIRITDSIKEMLDNLDDFGKIENLLNILGDYSIMAEQVILYYIFSITIKFKKIIFS